MARRCASDQPTDPIAVPAYEVIVRVEAVPADHPDTDERFQQFEDSGLVLTVLLVNSVNSVVTCFVVVEE